MVRRTPGLRVPTPGTHVRSVPSASPRMDRSPASRTGRRGVPARDGDDDRRGRRAPVHVAAAVPPAPDKGRDPALPGDGARPPPTSAARPASGISGRRRAAARGSRPGSRGGASWVSRGRRPARLRRAGPGAAPPAPRRPPGRRPPPHPWRGDRSRTPPASGRRAAAGRGIRNPSGRGGEGPVAAARRAPCGPRGWGPGAAAAQPRSGPPSRSVRQ